MPLIILDRDGVINHDSEHYIKHPDEFVPIEGSLEAIARLNRSGWRVYLATNQAGIARGHFGYAELAAIHAKLHEQLQLVGGYLDGIFFCPCLDCDCRKPAPGMLTDIAKRLHQPISDVPFVGDSLRDLQAGDAAGAQPILVKTGNGEATIKDLGISGLPAGTEIYASLAEYVNMLLSSDGHIT